MALLYHCDLLFLYFYSNGDYIVPFVVEDITNQVYLVLYSNAMYISTMQCNFTTEKQRHNEILQTSNL